ncbi:MAG TPA: penicillin-binding protein [Vicinamibacterales bacterium]|jgi:cell division protein FtsI (penicillin-binding protein 3)|nr:penicillin-binding protein [Vicinamibacterales bacterium]
MTAPAWRHTLKKRLATVAGLLALWVSGIEARLVFLQVISHDDLSARAERQQKRTQDAPGKRGDILDRHGRVLATSLDADSIYAVPSEIGNADEAVAALCRAFGDCTTKERQSLLDKLSRRSPFAYVRRQVSPEVAKRVSDLNLDGISSLKESKRFYPNRELSAHVLGWVGIDNNGLGGIESTYDRDIRGKKGTILIQTDARRRAFSRVERPPTTGATVELTIDEYLQHIAERELHAGVLENRAAGGSAIIMDPRTGEILAMANEPTFNPNAFRDFDDDDRRNRAIQDLYEPGSTFKVVTASAAIEEKVLPVDTLIDTNPGRLRIGARLITDDGGRNNGVLSFTNVIVKSSNIGAIKIGFRVGTERMSRFVSLYGFGHQVSPDFPSENPGIVWHPEKWTDSALASVSMGYQVAVTPLQMVAAVSSVANGGVYIEPRAFRAIIRNGVRYQVKAKELRRTISADTAAALTSIMEAVVTDGTAKRARMDRYTIAGKTGTAQKLINGHYSHSDHYASFVGFLPSRDPALAIVVVIDSAKGLNGDHGGVVAAPIFKNIAQAAIRYLGIPPTINPETPVLVARFEEQQTAPGVTLITNNPGQVPDVRGMSARDAVRSLLQQGINARLSGDGVVVSQSPSPGEPLEGGGVCRLTLERLPSPRSAEPVRP